MGTARPRTLWRVALAWVVAGLAPAGVAAQSLPADATRQEEWATSQAAKAAHLHDDERPTLERTLLRVKHMFGDDQPVGVHVGGVLDGSGIAAGPAYARRIGDTARLSVTAAWSVKNARGAELRLDAGTAAARWQPSLEFAWADVPRVGYRGVGPASPASRRDSYGLRTVEAGAGVRVRLGVVGLRGELGVLDVAADATTDAPGADLTYARSRLAFELGTPILDAPGARLRVRITDFRGGGAHDFQQIDAEAQHVLPVLRRHWTLVVQGRLSETLTSPGHRAPMALLPALGGQTLRGYSAWRFRDRSRAVATGEYRWATGPHLSLAAFMDAGAVGPSVGALRGRDVATSHGLGVILHTAQATLARFDVARSREGFSVHFSVRPRF